MCALYWGNIDVMLDQLLTQDSYKFPFKEFNTFQQLN